MKIFDTVKLIGISAKGRQRVVRDGSEWKIVNEINGRSTGAWLIESVIDSDQVRWISKNNDKNFEIEAI